MSFAVFKNKDIKPLGKLILKVLKLVHVVEVRETKGEDGQYTTEMNNLTLINLLLRLLGPMHERSLVMVLLFIQVRCSYSLLSRLGNIKLTVKPLLTPFFKCLFSYWLIIAPQTMLCFGVW